jgi:hypothetical protein
VDKDKKAIEEMSTLPVETHIGEGLSVLRQFLPEDKEAYIIPAVPFHLAFEFILLNQKQRREKELRSHSFPDFRIP